VSSRVAASAPGMVLGCGPRSAKRGELPCAKVNWRAIAAAALLSTSVVWAASGDTAGDETGASAPSGPSPKRSGGKKVTDNYRYMEALDPTTARLDEGGGHYTRSVSRQHQASRRSEDEGRQFSPPASASCRDYASFGVRAFYEEARAGVRQFRSHGQGRERRAQDRRRGGVAGRPWRQAVRDQLHPCLARTQQGRGRNLRRRIGRRVAHRSMMRRAASRLQARSTARSSAPPLDRRFADALFQPAEKLPPTDAPRRSTRTRLAELLGSEIRAGSRSWFGARATAPRSATTNSPGRDQRRRADRGGALHQRRAETRFALWTAPIAQVNDPRPCGRSCFTHDDGITNADERGDDLFFLSHKDAPTFKILTLKVGQPLSRRHNTRAGEIRPGDRIDARGIRRSLCAGAPRRLFAAPAHSAGSMAIEEVPLPFEGHIGECLPIRARRAPRISLSSWVCRRPNIRTTPRRRNSPIFGIGTRGDMDSANYVVSDLEAKAHDGTMVPLSLVQKKGVKGPQITLIEAYGSYGISELADFSTRRAAAMREGIKLWRLPCARRRRARRSLAAWRQGCEQTQHLGRPDRLRRIRGVPWHHDEGEALHPRGSAGGITMGRALTTRPICSRAWSISCLPATRYERNSRPTGRPTFLNSAR